MTSGLLNNRRGEEREDERKRKRDGGGVRERERGREEGGEMVNLCTLYTTRWYSLCCCHQYVETDEAHLKAVKELNNVHEIQNATSL